MLVLFVKKNYPIRDDKYSYHDSLQELTSASVTQCDISFNVIREAADLILGFMDYLAAMIT